MVLYIATNNRLYRVIHWLYILDRENNVSLQWKDEDAIQNLVQVLKLAPSKNTTIHASVLLRTAVFSVMGREKDKQTELDKHDLSRELGGLEICQREGYDQVIIEGQRLNVETDFRVWCGIIKAFSLYGKDSATIRLSFQEFAGLCNYSSKRFNAQTRKALSRSFKRLMSKTIYLRRKIVNNEDKMHETFTRLIHTVKLHEDEDYVELVGASDLWELYAIDHQILISRHILDKLPRAETAQALYLYLASMTKNPYPISLERMRMRCQLKGEVKQQNLKIRKAIDKLIEIGYLTGEWGDCVRNGKEFTFTTDAKKKEFFKITKRNSRLTVSEQQAMLYITQRGGEMTEDLLGEVL